MRNHYARLWDELLQSAVDAGVVRRDTDLGVIRLFLIGALNWTVEWYNPDRGSFKTFSRQITAIVFDGIAPQHGASRRVMPTRSGGPG